MLAFVSRQWHSRNQKVCKARAAANEAGSKRQTTPTHPPLPFFQHWDCLLTALRAMGYSPASLHSGPTGSLQPSVQRPDPLTSLWRVWAFHKAKTEKKGRRVQAGLCLRDKSGSILLQVKVFGVRRFVVQGTVWFKPMSNSFKNTWHNTMSLSCYTSLLELSLMAFLSCSQLPLISAAFHCAVPEP